MQFDHHTSHDMCDHSDPYYLWIADETDGWVGVTMLGHTAAGATIVIHSLTAAICHYCWVRRLVDGIPSSERSGVFRGWSVIYYCCNWFVIFNRWFTACDYLRFPYWRVSVSGYQFSAIRRPFRYGATGANTLRMRPISPREIRQFVWTYVSVYWMRDTDP